MKLDELSRVIGSIESKLKAQEDHNKFMRDAIKSVKNDVMELKLFKWKVTFIMVGVVSVFTVASQVIFHYMKGQ